MNKAMFRQDIERALTSDSKRLPQDVLKGYVERYFAHQRLYLDCISRNHSPLYVLQTDILERSCAVFRKAFIPLLDDARLYFAVKSNNCPEVSRIVLDNGFGLDVSSGTELQMALALGAADVVFSGPGKTKSELLLAAYHADRVVVLLDSFHELERLEEAAATMQRRVRAGVRISVDPKGLWRKFGICLEDLPAFWQKAQTCNWVDLQGIQFHSSWNMGPERQVAFIGKLGGNLAAMPADFLQALSFIDIGGGYWPPEGEWLQEAGTTAGMVRKAMGMPVNSAEIHFWNEAQPIEVFAREIASAVRTHIFPVAKCRICLEPGRWICNDSMQLMMTVVDKKAPDLVITDAGTNAVGWERFEVDYFPILNLSRPAVQEHPCMVLGSLCTPHDVWGYSYWGTGLEEGDILLIPMQGAYTYSLRQEFIKPLPGLVVL